MKGISRLSLPMRAPEDVRPHLGKDYHWQPGKSAQAVAHRWFEADGIPVAVRDVLGQVERFGEARLVDAFLERNTHLRDGCGAASQSDLLAIVTADHDRELAVWPGRRHAAGECRMTPLTRVEGRAYPLGRKNVDTDVIIPAHYLKTITRAGLGRGAFETIRAEPGNVFDDPRYAGAPIIVAGDNFGCGSSREHAAWALVDMGVRAVIAPSFSDIFSGNAFKNGIATVVLPQAAIDRLLAVATDGITVDLETQTVTTPFQDRFEFTMDPFRRDCLLGGKDEIGLTLAMDDAIARFEGAMAEARPWL